MYIKLKLASGLVLLSSLLSGCDTLEVYEAVAVTDYPVPVYSTPIVYNYEYRDYRDSNELRDMRYRVARMERERARDRENFRAEQRYLALQRNIAQRERVERIAHEKRMAEMRNNEHVAAQSRSEAQALLASKARALKWQREAANERAAQQQAQEQASRRQHSLVASQAAQAARERNARLNNEIPAANESHADKLRRSEAAALRRSAERRSREAGQYGNN